jgi:hypothetical protein
MKKIIFTLLLACCAALNAEDCSKSTDACTAGGKKTILSPFLAASSQPLKAAPAAAPAVKAAPAVPPAPEVPAPAAPAAAPAPLQDRAGNISSPLWLLLVGGGLAGLYFYLGGKKKKGKRK